MDLVPERLRNRIVTSLLMIAGFAVLFFLLQQLTFLLRFAPYERTTLWVPGALTFSALLVTPIWTWWRVYIGLCLAAYAAYYNDPHIPAPIALLTAQFHFVSVAAGVWALRRLTLDAPFASIGSMLVFVIAAGIMIPLATSIPSDGLRWLRGDPDFLAVGIRTFLCVALGMLIATPAITTAIVHGLDALRFGSGWRWIEGVSLAICLVSVGLWVFNTSSDSNAFPALIYAPVPFLLWAALRFEVAGAAWAILVIAYVSTWNAIHGRGPFVSGAADDHVLQLQLFLASVSLPLLFMAAGIGERRRAHLMLMREMEERQRMEEGLRHASRLAILSEFSASIAHEINQPLGAILSNADAAEMLLEGPTPPLDEVRRILADIRSDDLRASDVIRKMRALMRRGEVELHPIEVNDVVHEVIDILRTEAQRQDVEVLAEMESIDSVVMGDRVHLQQVLLNLMVNGMEAMQESTRDKRLTISTQHRGNEILVSVADRGPGIPSEHLPRLFDQFFSTKREGMGMGLAISRSLVEAHGGRIWAENVLHQGARFSFTLPPVERPL